jgi:hypothetical protein
MSAGNYGIEPRAATAQFARQCRPPDATACGGQKGCQLPRNTYSSLVPKAAILVAVICLGALVAGSSATAKSSAKHGLGVDTVTMKQKASGRPFFKVESDTVNPGESMVTKKSLPQTKNEFKACFNLKAGSICRAIARWHKINLQTFEVGQPEVEVGNPGWDTLGKARHKKGDSWYTETEDETTSRIVSAAPGKTLYFMCAVHPEMQGKIKVNEL